MLFARLRLLTVQSICITGSFKQKNVRYAGGSQPLVVQPAARRNVTIVDIARLAGVSRSAVSLVLRAQTGVGAETRERVTKAMRELGYVYNRGAANLRQSRSSVVGMIINDLTNPFFAQLAVGIERALSIAGHMPFMANTGESVVRQAELMRSMREHGAAGLIICPAFDTDADQLNDIASEFPLVLAVRRIARARVASAVSENQLGARRATEHLLALGHRRIAFLGGRSPAMVRDERVAGYRAAMLQKGIALDPALEIASMPTRVGGVDAMNAALGLAARPTAFLCFNDVVAMGAMIAASRHGLKVGTDVAVVGFDDIAEASLVTPALTTVAVNAEALGEHAARLLLDQIRGGVSAAGSYVGDARLVVRGSCGALSV
jgi:LacI family transcriptional regulator